MRQGARQGVRQGGMTGGARQGARQGGARQGVKQVWCLSLTLTPHGGGDLKFYYGGGDTKIQYKMLYESMGQGSKTGSKTY